MAISQGAYAETPVDRYLRGGQLLDTPVTRVGLLGTRELIPLSKPGPGEQYAFEVDLDACSGCKACVAACHSLNGLDEHESWRDVGLLKDVESGSAYLQTVTTACHHCVDPGCLNGCPVDAYEKDEETGVVVHLDDQCIGCEYCTMTCPYDVPKYNERLGIVRKCDLCHERLAEGEAPACAQACPTAAIAVTTVRVDDLIAEAKVGLFLAGSPDPDITVPSTQYRSRRRVPETAHGPAPDSDKKEKAHWPLIIMLVLTQFSVGFALAGVYHEGSRLLMGAALALHLVGLAASVLHLGQPLRAWRFFLGLTHSWLSREILAFSLYAAGLGAALLQPAWALPAALLGLIGVFTSVMVYHVTRRPDWHWFETAPRFLGSILFGSLTAVLLLEHGWLLGLGALLATAAIGLFERYNFFTQVRALRMPGVPSSH